MPQAIGAIFLAAVAIAAILAAIALMVTVGSLIGTGVALVNYCKAFQANVRFERPSIK